MATRKEEVIEHIKETPWVQSPRLTSTKELFDTITVGDTYYYRGSGESRTDINELEQLHRNWVRDIIDLDEYEHMYFTNGITDAIHQWLLAEDREWQFLHGDYAYAQYMTGKGHHVQLHEISPDRVLYITNPSCSNGNYLPDETIDYINEVGCPVVLDMAYVGAIAIQKVKKFKNAEQIWFGFSKGWGAVGQRCGIVYSKELVTNLQMQKNVELWDYTSVNIAKQIIKNYKVDTVYYQMRKYQHQICEEHGWTPSQTFFLALADGDEYSERVRSGDGARLCITPLFYIGNIDEIY